MKLLIRPKALKSLERIALYVESRNTKGSGERFLGSFLKTIHQYAVDGASYQPCKHASLASNRYLCIFLENWVIAFKIQGEKFIICRIVWGPALS